MGPEHILLGLRQDDVGSGGFQSPHGRPDVPRAIVEDGDGRTGVCIRLWSLGRCVRNHQSAPFVEGMPSTLGSGSTAWRRARAKALNWASAMWWGSRPRTRSTWTQIPA
ncbi:hypothetical protein [Kocuria massiliensis]|uniref:hypothetical protein n=1 Tax=Kocuria massiliensis TaxID=1926282 RepID=UPI003CCBCF4E